jgi:hypothetical protein
MNDHRNPAAPSRGARPSTGPGIYNRFVQERAVGVYTAAVRDMTEQRMLSGPQFERDLEAALQEACGDRRARLAG